LRRNWRAASWQLSERSSTTSSNNHPVVWILAALNHPIIIFDLRGSSPGSTDIQISQPINGGFQAATSNRISQKKAEGF